MYVMYIGLTPMPIFPESISIKTGTLNKTMTLINEGEINLIKTPALKEFTFDLLIPNTPYPFAYYRNGFKGAGYYLEKFESIKKSGGGDILLIVRIDAAGNPIYNTDMWVTLEEYIVRDDVREGTDIIVTMRLKEYKNHGVKTYKITSGKIQQKGVKRNTSNSPSPKNNNKTYIVQSGDTLWTIAKKFYGDGSKYTVLRDNTYNKIIIAKHGGSNQTIAAGDKLVIPAL